MQELNETLKFTRYTIEDTLGSGGMGTVYLAHHKILNRSVALKVPKQELAQNEVFVERFLREARALGTLNHPHIVTVYDAGIEQDTPYIAMEYVDGDTLAGSILDAGQVDIVLAVSWGLQMAKALAYLHHQHILHRDLKSANVIIDRAGNAVIADFGIAQIDQDSNLTRGILGTPSYISPEQARGESLDSRSDLYSLGVILYECLTGRVPFRDENSFALIQRVIHETPEDIWNHRPDAPPWLCDLVNKCLEKDPDRRYQNGTELASALQQGLPDNSPLMRSEPADTIVSHHTEEDSLAGKQRQYALTNLSKSLRGPTRHSLLVANIDPSPTVTLFGKTQIIEPQARESRLKYLMNPVSVSMILAILAAIIFIPVKQFPPKSASGQQTTPELALPTINSSKTRTPAKISASSNERFFEALSRPDTSGQVAELEPVLADTLPYIANGIFANLDSTLLAAEDAGILFYQDSTEFIEIDSLTFLSPELESIPIEELAAATMASSEEFEAELPLPESSDGHESVTEPASTADTESQQEHTRKVIDVRLPESIYSLAELKNRTQLIRALATLQQKKVLQFGERKNVKEPDLAFIFLINKDNKKIRGLLAPGAEGWTDVFSGKIVTVEKGRFYESEPGSESNLKWWLHDITPIWVELKQDQPKIRTPLFGKKKKKRMGW